MQFFRCRCGHSKSYSNMGKALCVVCPECKSTLSVGPDDHPEPIPHDWITVETRTTYQGQTDSSLITTCTRCHAKKPDDAAPFPSAEPAIG